MGHNPATRDAKKFERTKILETRSADDIIKGIRGNLVSPLTILKTDVAVLLKNYDAMVAGVLDLQAQLAASEALVVDLKAKVEEFRSVYDQENRSTTITFEHGGEA